VEVTTPERSPTALVPRGTGDDDLEVIARGGPAGEWLETTVAVRPSPNLEYFIRTMHREGMRPMPHGAAISLDGSIQGAARTAVMDLFLSAIPPEEPRPESIEVVEEAMGRAAELGDQVLNRDVWTLHQLHVDDRVLLCSYSAFQRDSLRLPISDRASSEPTVDRSHRHGGAHSAQPQNCTPPCESKSI
jgi:hypothetical protein